MRAFFAFIVVFFSTSPAWSDHRPAIRQIDKVALAHRFVTPIKRLVVPVPVYRELYSENIGRLLSSLAKQKETDLPLQMDAIFLVNNTADAEPHIRTENQEMAEFLNILSRGATPRVRASDVDLLQAIEDVKRSRLRIHVMDRTTPGIPGERNIGRIRDLVNQKALSLIRPDEDDTTLVLQMDGDCIVPLNLARGLQSVFSTGMYKWGMLGLELAIQPGSRAEVFQRYFIDSFDMAYWEYEAAVKRQTTRSGSPRIVALASALRAVGGIPHVDVAEDWKVVENLLAHFPGQLGVAIPNLSVKAGYRARPDSFDGKGYLERLERGNTFHPPSGFASALEHQEAEIASWGTAWAGILAEEKAHLLHSVRTSAAQTRAEAEAGLVSLITSGGISGVHRLTELTKSEWWPQKARAVLFSTGNIHDALLALEREFPDQLSLTPSTQVQYWARIRAATAVLRLRQISPNHFDGLNGNWFASALEQAGFGRTPPQPQPTAPKPAQPVTLITQPVQPLRTNVHAMRIDMNSSACTLQLHADPNCGFWREPIQIARNVGQFAYKVNPAQPVHIVERSCANTLWVAAQLHLTHDPHQSVSSLQRF